MGRGRRRWLASERVAVRVLEERGFRVVRDHVKIVIDGVEVAEVDFVAEGPDGEMYAVEVKAGRLDVNGVRQAYVNAKVLGYRPLVVCKGFADDAAAKLAEKLGVKVIELEDVFLIDAEELEHIVEAAAAEVIVDILQLLLDRAFRPKPSDIEALKALAEEPTVYDAARRLGVSVKELQPLVEMLKRSRLARQGPWGLRAAARLLLYRARIEAQIETLERSVERLEKLLSSLG
ncbi:MAG: recombinase RecB [Crenarchaeota archaeon]|nr:recombinase RecB [Thermoproteota archaeon]